MTTTDSPAMSASSGIATVGNNDCKVVRFSTADYAPHERLDAWREIYGRTLAKVDVEPLASDQFFTEATLRRMPGLAVNVVRRSPVIHNRRREFISHDDVGMTVGLTSHFEANQFGRTLTMSRGEAIVLTGAETAEDKGDLPSMDEPSRSISAPASRRASISTTSSLLAAQCNGVSRCHIRTAGASRSAPAAASVCAAWPLIPRGPQQLSRLKQLTGV
jgi:hypothetical protein